MFRSISTTWGLVAATRATAASPSAAWPGHGDPGQRAEQQHQALADGGLVVDDDDGDRGVGIGHAGILKCTLHCPSSGPAVSVPPASAARSRSPVSP